MMAVITALAVTVALIAGSVYLINVLWPLLPGWMMLILFMLLAVIVIGYPIFSLARWSDRRLQRQRQSGAKPQYKHDTYADEDD